MMIIHFIKNILSNYLIKKIYNAKIKHVDGIKLK